MLSCGMSRQAPPGSAVTGVPVPVRRVVEVDLHRRVEVVLLGTGEIPGHPDVDDRRAELDRGRRDRGGSRGSGRCGGRGSPAPAAAPPARRSPGSSPSSRRRPTRGSSARSSSRSSSYRVGSVEAPLWIVMLRRNGARLPAASCSQPVRWWLPSASAPVGKDADGPLSEGAKPAASAVELELRDRGDVFGRRQRERAGARDHCAVDGRRRDDRGGGVVDTDVRLDDRRGVAELIGHGRAHVVDAVGERGRVDGRRKGRRGAAEVPTCIQATGPPARSNA